MRICGAHPANKGEKTTITEALIPDSSLAIGDWVWKPSDKSREWRVVNRTWVVAKDGSAELQVTICMYPGAGH